MSVETSAYALLAQMELGDYNYARRIAMWLSDQQNYGGAFISTQVEVEFWALHFNFNLGFLLKYSG